MRYFAACVSGMIHCAHTCAGLAALLCLAWNCRLASGQLGRDSVPSTRYLNTFNLYYEGDYRDALAAYLDEGRSGIHNAQTRWIDSICYYTMSGECFYQLGRLPQALDQYTRALQISVAYSNWMVSAQFPAVIQPGAVGSQLAVPWGVTKRPTRVGHFTDSFLMAQGNINSANNAVRSGGVVQQPVLFPVRVADIVRATTLAMRRRRELLGPVSKYDPLNNELVAALARRPGQPNNWSEAWIDIQLGAAYASIGNVSQAVSALERAIIVQGEFDHPLTPTALLEMGRLALEVGNFSAAARYFEEATYAAVNFSDLIVLEEAFRYGQLTHLLTNQKGVYPPLPNAIAWAKVKGFRQLHASLSLLACENLANLGDTQGAAAMLATARNSVGRGDLLLSSTGARLNYLGAVTMYQAGNTAAGDQSLAAALLFQKNGSLWMFHMGLADGLYMSGDLSDRVGLMLYDVVLRDPTPADWATSPLECLSVLTSPHPAPLEHWFEAVLKQGKEYELALEIADRSRRHRFFSTLPMGGRLLALRWILEGPKELLSDQALLQRQDLMTRYTKYEQLAGQARKLRAELLEKPLVAETPEARKEQTGKLGALGAASQAQEIILREIGVRRDPADFIFPPLRRTKDIQQALAPGQVLLAFFATTHSLHAFMFSRDKYAMWQINAPAQLQKQMTSMLREMGHFEQNHQLSQAELTGGNWKKSAAKVMELLFEKSNVDLSAKFDELIIVPDGLLWYLPFEALPVGKGENAKPLISQVKIRYAPTAGLAIPYAKIQKRQANAGVVIGKLFPHDEPEVAHAAFEQLSKSVPGAMALPQTAGLLPAPSSLYRSLFDELIVLDDVEPDAGGYDWSPMQIDRGKPGSNLASWFSLPWGGPQEILLPGFHSAAENSLKKNVSGGNDLFLSICGLMSAGSRTILISRWRSGGQTSFDLVREFAQELPHTNPADAWQRATALAVDAPLDAEVEPRVKKLTGGTAGQKTDHPFFWAGYMLVDSGRLSPSAEPPSAPMLNFKGKQPPVGKGAPPPPPGLKPFPGGPAAGIPVDKAADKPEMAGGAIGLKPEEDIGEGAEKANGKKPKTKPGPLKPAKKAKGKAA